MKRFAFIYNPAARGGKSESKVSILKNRIESLPKARLFRSKRKGDIAELIDEQFEHYEVFVACGGDGTIREVASKLIHTDKQMGIVPMGTGNDLCKTLEIPTDLDRSIEIVLQNKATKIDVGRCNDFIFLNVLGFGFDGLTNRYAVEMKNIHPFFKYSISALKAALHQPSFDVRLDGADRRKAIMLTLANGRVEGGAFWIAPDASITDEKLNLITISSIPKWLIPFLLPLFLFKKAHWIPHVQSQKTNKLRLIFDQEVEIHADGEMVKTDTNNFDIHLLPSALQVLSGL